MRSHTRRVGLALFALTLTALFALAHAATATARPWLGVYTQEITGDLRDGMDLHAAGGVLVNRVVADGPADRAGVRSGDVILRFNARTVESPEDLARMVGAARERQAVSVEVLRRGERRTYTVTLAAASEDGARGAPAAPRTPPTPPTPPRLEDMGHGDSRDDADRHEVRVKVFRNGDQPESYRVDGDLDQLPGKVREMLHGVPGLDGNGGLHALRVMGASRGRLGVRIESLNEDLAAALGAPGAEGVLVLEVMSDTPAERAGLRSGDVIITVGGQDVKDAEELVEALRDVDGKVSITVSRKGTRRTVEAELAATPRTSRGQGPRAGHGRMGETDREDRLRDRSDADNGDLRQQMEELRQQLRELRQQLEDQHHE
jgi:membrane-associated protease RseP (regulator of RpoE activity)